MGHADPHEQRSSRTLCSLQCVRAFAVMLVVYYHATAIAVPSLSTAWPVFTPPAPHLTLFGQCGVDLFFVLSGFVMWTTTLPQIDLVSFYKRRIARIVPLYWIVTLAIAATALIAPFLFHTIRFSTSHVLASLAFVPWPNPAFPPTSAGYLTPLLVAGWTVNFEMMFYLLFGLTAARRTHRLAMLFGTFGAFICVSMALRGVLSFLRFYDPLLFVEFLLGCGVAVAVTKRWLLSPTVAVVLLPAVTMALCALDSAGYTISRLLYLGIPATILIYTAVSLEAAGQWPRLAAVKAVGDASFSIYLTHTVALAAMRFLWHPIAACLVAPLCQAAFIGSVIVTSLALGVAVYRWIERPSLRFAERSLGVDQRASVSSAATASASSDRAFPAHLAIET